MQITNKGKTVTLNKTERLPLEKAKELLEGLACLPFEGQEASKRAIGDISTVLKATEKPTADGDQGKPLKGLQQDCKPKNSGSEKKNAN